MSNRTADILGFIACIIMWSLIIWGIRSVNWMDNSNYKTPTRMIDGVKWEVHVDKFGHTTKIRPADGNGINERE